MNQPNATRIDADLQTELTTTLTERRDTLIRQLEQLAHELPGVATDGEAQPNEPQLSRARHEQIASALRDTDLALARLDHLEFGRCESCAQPIAPDRLRALPDTTRCTACASQG